MKSSNLRSCLMRLRLTPKEAARLLSVDVKTVNRWIERKVAVPGPAADRPCPGILHRLAGRMK